MGSEFFRSMTCKALEDYRAALLADKQEAAGDQRLITFINRRVSMINLVLWEREDNKPRAVVGRIAGK